MTDNNLISEESRIIVKIRELQIYGGLQKEDEIRKLNDNLRQMQKAQDVQY